MVDTITKAERSQVMAKVGSKDTRPELIIRRGLHARGFRYRLHDRKLPGKPDLVFPRYRAVIFVNGCFWHGHDCPRCRMPSSNTAYWHGKIASNVTRDKANRLKLLAEGWRVLTIWECALVGKGKLALIEVLDRASEWLQSNEPHSEISGRAANTSAGSKPDAPKAKTRQLVA